jgi:hypothetical protein
MILRDLCKPRFPVTEKIRQICIPFLVLRL